MGRTDEGAKSPVTRRSRLLVMRCAVRCFVTPLKRLPTTDTITYTISTATATTDQGRINYLVGPTHSTTPGPHWKA